MNSLILSVFSLFSGLQDVGQNNLFSYTKGAFYQEYFSENFHQSPEIAFKNDDTQLLQSYLNNGGDIILEANRTYKVNKPLVIKKSGTKIIGNNALIQYQNEQKQGVGKQHLFIVEDKNNVQFLDLKLQYLGTFSFKESYGGKISGIYIEGSDNFLARNVEAFGFNRAGIDLATESKAPYNNSPIIEKCHLHHNRVAGCLYGNNEGGMIINNEFSNNGLEEDTGTGYGFAGWSSSLPKNTTVKNNTANYNIRKGLDFHAGENGIITGNTCIGNRITGIFALNVKGNWDISDNLVDSMDGQKTSYHTVTGIEVGDRSRNKNPKEPINFKIENNIISNFTGSEKNASYPIYIQANSIGSSSISIQKNNIECDAVTGIIRVNSGNQIISDYYDIVINNNTLSANMVKSPAIYLRGKNNRRKIIQNNRITVHSDNDKVNFLILNDATSVPENCLVVTDNRFNIPVRASEGKIFTPIQIRKVSNERVRSNRVNSKKLSNWNGISSRAIVEKLISEILLQK